MRGEKERQIWTYGRVLYLSAGAFIDGATRKKNHITP